jgi:hypothetical protein
MLWIKCKHVYTVRIIKAGYNIIQLNLQSPNHNRILFDRPCPLSTYVSHKSPISLSLLFLSSHALLSPTQIGSMATTNPSPRSIIMHKWRRQDSIIENNSNGILDPNSVMITAVRGKNIYIGSKSRFFVRPVLFLHKTIDALPSQCIT